MKIAVVHNLPAGGQKRALYNQVRLLSRNHQLDLYTLSSTNCKFKSLKPYVDKQITVEYVYPNYFPANLWSIYFKLPQAYRQIADKINSGGYNIVYVNPCWLTQAPFILRFLKIPSLYYCPEAKREFYESIPRRSNKWRYLINYPFRIPIKYIDFCNTRAASLILTNSYFSKDQIEKLYQIKAKVNYLGVDTSVFKPIGIKKENMVISVGEFSLLKGYDFIIRSLSLVSKNIRPRLICVGHGGVEKKYLEKLALSLGVDMNWQENIADSKLVNLYNKAKIFLYASLREPFGMALLEAASCGLPIMAVNEGGVSEILSSVLFKVLTKRSEAEFASAIEQLLTKPLTIEQKYKQYEYIKKKWNWEKSVKELERQMISSSSRRYRSA